MVPQWAKLVQITPISCGLTVDDHIELLNEDYKPTNNTRVVTLEIIMDLQTPGLPRKVIHFHCGFSIEFCGYLPEGIIVQNICRPVYFFQWSTYQWVLWLCLVRAMLMDKDFICPLKLGRWVGPVRKILWNHQQTMCPPFSFKQINFSFTHPTVDVIYLPQISQPDNKHNQLWDSIIITVDSTNYF